MKETQEKKGQWNPGLQYSLCVIQDNWFWLREAFELPSVVAGACHVGLLVNKGFLPFTGKPEGSLKAPAGVLLVSPY